MALLSPSVFLFFIRSFFFSHSATFVSTLFSLKVSTFNVGLPVKLIAVDAWETMSENLMLLYRYIRWLIEHRNGIAVYHGGSLINPVSSRLIASKFASSYHARFRSRRDIYQNEYTCSTRLKLKLKSFDTRYSRSKIYLKETSRLLDLDHL